MRKGFFDLLLLPILGLLILGVGLLSPWQPIQTEEPIQTNIGYTGTFTVEFKPAGSDDWQLIDSGHNLVTNSGWDALMDLINGQQGNGFNWSVLGNTSVPVVGSTSHPGEISGSGLGGKLVDSITDNSPGNRTTSTLWTYTGSGSLIANTTGFYNASSGTYILGVSFNDAPFNTNGDQLRVNHTMAFTEP